MNHSVRPYESLGNVKTSLISRTISMAGLFVGAMLLILCSSNTASAQFGNVTLTGTANGNSGATITTSLTWSHTVPNSSNRALVVTIASHRTGGTLPTVSAVSFGAQAMTSIVATIGNAQDGSKRTEMWGLVAPNVGTSTITVTLSPGANIVGASYSFSSVDQAAPIFNAGNNAAINTPSNSAAALAICPLAFAQSAVVDVVAVEATNSATPASGQMNVSSLLTNGGSPGDDLLGRSGDFDPPPGVFTVSQYTLGAADFWCMSALTLNPAALTSVGIESVDARYTHVAGVKNPGVQVSWRTGQEANNLGFRVYRERDGARIQITPEIIAGSTLFTPATLSAGYRYSWWDPTGRPGDTYLLEDIDLAGSARMQGPYTAIQATGTVANKANSATLSEIGSAPSSSQTIWLDNELSSKAAATADNATQFQLAASAAVKLGVRQTGWYRVPQRSLAAAGFQVAGADPRNFKLFVGGSEIPIRVSGESDGRFDATDAVEFFGTGLDVQSTDTQIYWLASTPGAGLRIKAPNSRAGNGPAISYPTTVELKERLVYFAALSNGETDNFFGKVVAASQAADHTITVSNLDPSNTNAVVDVTLQGVTIVPHAVSVNLNGQYVGEITFSDKSRGTGHFTVPPSFIHEGANVVSLIPSAGANPTDVSIVDTIRLSYSHAGIADQNLALVNIVNGSGARAIGGFSTSQIQAFDITNPLSVQQVAGAITLSKTGYAISVRPDASTERLFVIGSDRTLSPASITLNQPSQWNSATNSADVVMITHHDLAASLAPLKAYRESQGHSVAVVDVEDLFDEFSAGVRTPDAIKAFTASAHGWTVAPRYVLLAGDATYDPRNYLGTGFTGLVPTKLLDSSNLEHASDDWLVDANGDELPDFAVGRLPVRTPAEAAAVIAKIISYESTGTSNKTAMLVTDINDISDFVGTTAEIQALLPADYAASVVSRGVLGDVATRQAVLSGANSGPGIVNFAGHGSIDIWRGGILQSGDAASFTNSGRLSLYVAANCLNGYFQDTSLDSLGEALLKAPNGGAIAVWASSGTTGPEGQRILVEEFYRLLFSGQNLTMGEAAAHAKAASAADVRRSWIFIGDPVTRLK